MSNKTFETEQALDDGMMLLELCKEQFKDPLDALFAMVVAIAAISKGLDMSLPNLFKGIRLAREQMSKEDR